MTLEAIILAVDGVIADTHEARREAFNDVFSEAGLGWYWDRETYAQLLKAAGDRELVAGVLIGAFLKDRVTRPRHLGDLSNMIAAIERRHASLLRDRFKSRRVELRAGVAAFLQAAAKEQIILAIVSRGDDENVRALLESSLPFDLNSAIEIVSFGGPGTLRRQESPHLEVAAMLDVDIRNCLVVDSSMRSLAEANAAGMPSLMTWGLYPRWDEISSPSDAVHAPSIANAARVFLSRWDCAPASKLLSYIRDLHTMQCGLLCPESIFPPSTAITDKEVKNAGLRYLEA
jgi:beta-phosphoglucomutase-like phosphatase (HAD superfamily)